MIRRHPLSIYVLAFVLTGSLLAGHSPASGQNLDQFEHARVLRVLSLLAPNQGAPSLPGPAAKMAGADDATGTISGTIQGLDLEGFESAAVVAWQADSIAGEETAIDGAQTVARAMVEPDGSYRLTQLGPGTYYVSAMAKGYETLYWEDAFGLDAATPVELADGASVEGIDFAMERLNSGTGSIAGIVVGENGEPIAGAVVHAFGAASPFTYALAETDEFGAYNVRGLRSGDYVVEVLARDYLPEFYGDVTAYEQAVLVAVLEPDQTAAVDFELSPGGSITGIVRSEDGHPLAGAYVWATSPDQRDREEIDIGPEDGLLPAPSGGWAVTDEDGVYRMGGLATGDYRVQSQYSTRWQHVSIWYDGATSFDQATSVTVAVGQQVEDIDMTLPLPVASSGVSGRVSDANGRPLPKAFITVQTIMEESFFDSVFIGDDLTEPGQIAGSADSVTDAVLMPVDESMMGSRIWAYTSTDEDGSYVIDELPAGTYIVSAATENSWQYVQRWYPDAHTPRDATELVVGESEQLTDIDIVLPVRTATASISGTVHDQDGAPLKWAFVEVSQPGADPTLAGDERGRFWAYGQTDEAGSYRIDRLPAGTYALHASYHTGDTYGESWYDGADTPEMATPLMLTDDASRSGIDFQLIVRPLYGEVTGTVTDALRGAPMVRSYVELSPLGRDTRRGTVLRYEAFSAVTDESGTFRMPWIPEGAYSLTVYANGGSADYVHPDTDALSTPFEVVGGESTNRDVAIAVRADGSGVITGQVSFGYPGPIWYSGEEPAVGVIEADDLADVPPGADSSVTEGADVTDGSRILTDEIQAHSRIAVVVALPVAAADASIPYSGGQYVAVTDTDGAYALRGLAPGDYTIMCFAPGHIGTYYEGEYDPQKARTITVDATQETSGIDFELAGYYRIYAVAEDATGDGLQAPSADESSSGSIVFGNVADDTGEPVQDATVYLLDTQEQPVAFAQTGSDGNFELPGIAPGEYRVYASRVGFTGSYNGNELDFAAAEPLGLATGQLEVNLVLIAGIVTAVEEEEDDAATPMAMALHRNYPNPFNPETRISFSVPDVGYATVVIHNALGQRVATLHDGPAETGRVYEVMFRAKGLATGIYFYALEFEGQRLTHSMMLVR
ncbi:MAG: hypothetical protein HN712_07875 [Gemmatimonadetes bacterium]|nr:hypothetical protein [Gemmatimonadota bacterium]MBT7860216.1 hypothetical protein [Gemmatimonadota bacterium]